MGRRSPQEMFSSPSTMNSSSSCPRDSWHGEPAQKTPQNPAARGGTVDSALDAGWLGAPVTPHPSSRHTPPQTTPDALKTTSQVNAKVASKLKYMYVNDKNGFSCLYTLKKEEDISQGK